MRSKEIRLHSNHSQLYKTKMKKITEITRIMTPRADEVLDILGYGSFFSVFVLFAGFTYLFIHPASFPSTAFYTPNGPYEWLRMPQGASGTPASFVWIVLLVTAALDNIWMYLEDAVGSDDFLNIRQRLQLPFFTFAPP